MLNAAIIVAGGKGLRMQSEVPKQFLRIGNEPVLMQTITRFLEFDPGMLIVLVLPRGQKQRWLELINMYNFQLPHQLVDGGQTRYHSVKNGLPFIPDECIVGVHDGVRPFVSLQTIERCYSTATVHGNAVPVVPMNESLRMLSNGNSRVVDRDEIKIVQTPQVFQSLLLKKAYQLDWEPSITDDAGLVERLGIRINLVDGNRENIKITDPFDLKLAELILKGK
jgi:2-C-methyl-D-erythritol 4-phosphate cytidylyltransferase